MGSWTRLVPLSNRRPFRDLGLDRFPRTWHFLVAAFPCLAPCRDQRAFHLGATSGRPSTTSGSSCDAEDGDESSNHPDCSPQTRRLEIAPLLRALYFQGPTWIAAVVLLPCR